MASLTSEQRNAPLKLQTKFALRKLYEPWLSKYPDEKKDHIERFFHGTLAIPDCGLDDYVNELKCLQDSGSEDSDTITTFYEALYAYWNSDDTLKTQQQVLRSRFEEHALIYAASNDGSSWRRPSECVWSTAAQLRDKVSLNIEYQSLSRLFVDVLGVKVVTLEMAIKELKVAGDRQSTCVEEVKASLQTVNSLLCAETDQKEEAKFGESRIFPVRYPGGAVRCESAQTKFFIVDRESLQSKFGDHFKFLDFSLEEVSELRPFLEWAGLKERYVTRSVRESTSVRASEARPIFKPQREIRHRAHALLRYVCYIYVPRELEY